MAGGAFAAAAGHRHRRDARPVRRADDAAIQDAQWILTHASPHGRYFLESVTSDIWELEDSVLYAHKVRATRGWDQDRRVGSCVFIYHTTPPTGNRTSLGQL